MHMIRFEPIVIEDSEDFIELYNKLRDSLNRTYKGDHDEIIPAIRKIFAVDELGFPLDPTLNTK